MGRARRSIRQRVSLAVAPEIVDIADGLVEDHMAEHRSDAFARLARAGEESLRRQEGFARDAGICN